MWDKEKERIGLAVRSGIALGLMIVGIWIMGLTADVSGVQDKLETWSSMPTITVGLLTQQTGAMQRSEEATPLNRWGMLFLKQSAWLNLEPLTEFRHEAEQNELTKSEVPEQPTPDPETGETTLNTSQENHTDVIEMTGKGMDGMTNSQGVYLLNKSGCEVTAEDLDAPAMGITKGDGPQILIVHTHGSEAYTQTEEDPYEESDPYRTTDCTKNVVRVGEEMAMELRAYGFRVLHDTNLYDYPSYNGAYDRSNAAVKQWLQQYPTIQVVLDVHRDALVGQNDQPYKMVSVEAGQKVAQVMLVLGSNDKGADHPNWKQNLAFAASLQRSAIKSYNSLARPMVLRSGRFNQYLSTGSVLVEVGGHGNTLQEAISGARLWAASAARMWNTGEI